MKIDRKYIESLKEKIDADDYIRLSALFNGEITALKAYSSDASPANLRSWEAAQAALAKKVEEVAPVVDRGLDDTAVVGSISDVARYLWSEGYCAPGRDDPVKKSKVYQDRKAGVLKVADPKAVTMTEVMAYVAMSGLMKSGVSRADEAEDLNIQKLRYETRKSKADAERKEFDNEKEKGLYLKKQDVELETAIKIAAFDAAFRHLLRITAHEVVGMVGGDFKKAAILTHYYYPRIDDLLDDFGRIDTLRVTIKRQDG